MVFSAGWFLTTPGDFLDDPDLLVERYVDESGLYLAGAQMGVIAAAALLWFSGTVAAVLVANGADARHAGIARSGGTAAAALSLSGAAIITVGAFIADDQGQITTESATLLFNSGIALAAGAMPIGAAVLVAATGIASLRNKRFLPSWLEWASLLLAVALLIFFISFIAMIGFFVWVLVLAGLMIAGRLPFEQPSTGGRR